MRCVPALLFALLLAGAAVHGLGTVRALSRASGRAGLLPGRFRAPGGRTVTGYEYFGDTAAFLRREAGRGGARVFALAEHGEAGFWLSYLAYPVLVRFVPFLHAKHALRRLPPGRTLLVVVPGPRRGGPSPSPWGGGKVRAVLSALTGGAKAVLRHESPFGPRVYEVGP